MSAARIAYVHQYFTTPDSPGGGGTRSYEMARRLVDDGHEVHMITTDVDAPRPSRRWRTSLVAGIHVHALPVPYANEMGYRARIAAFARFALASTWRAAAVRPDVVLATSTPLTVAVPGVVAARVRRARFVFEVRDLWPELPIEVGALRHPLAKAAARALARFAYRHADAVIALSPGMADGVAAHGYPREQIAEVPNGCDLDRFDVPAQAGAAFRAARPWLGDRPLVLYAGTFGLVNGVGWLVRLAAEVAALDADVAFLLLGSGRERDQVEALAGELGVLGSSVFVEGPVPKASVPAALSAATLASSVFTTTGMVDNSANKFFDALAAGRSLLINHDGWQADLLHRTGAGLVLPREDLPAAARTLVARLRDETWLAGSRAAAGELARRRFSREALYARFADAVLPAATRPCPPEPAVAPGGRDGSA